MEIYFKEDYLRKMYQTGKNPDKKHRYQPEIISKYVRNIAYMENSDSIKDLILRPGLRYEKLIGDKKGLSAISINMQYRIEFEETIKDGQLFATICTITDLSNHYQ